MFRYTVFVVVGIALLILQANLFRFLGPMEHGIDDLCALLGDTSASWAISPLRFVGSLIATPNLVLPLIVFTGVHEYSMARGAALAFVLGYALDLFAAGPVGLFTFVSVATFVLARFAGVRLAASTVLTQLALAFAFALVHGITVLVLLAIFVKDPYAPKALVTTLLPSAVSTALASPFVFHVAQRIHQATVTVPRPGEVPLK